MIGRRARCGGGRGRRCWLRRGRAYAGGGVSLGWGWGWGWGKVGSRGGYQNAGPRRTLWSNARARVAPVLRELATHQPDVGMGLRTAS